MPSDLYTTIAAPSQGQYTEKRSKFLAFAFPVSSATQVKARLDELGRKYYDARHRCYAYMLGHARQDCRAVDDGEPSGTAGKPILGQINSRSLTDVLVVVVRYFGGVKLGTGGLLQAYKAAAAQALDAAQTVERTVDRRVSLTFEYPLMNQVMRIVKEEQPQVLDQTFQGDCHMTLAQRATLMPRLVQRLSQVEGVTVDP